MKSIVLGVLAALAASLVSSPLNASAPHPVGDAAPEFAATTVDSEPEPQNFIVVFREPALAAYDGSIPGLPKPEKIPGKGRLDVKNEKARRYVAHLKGRQDEHEAKIARAVGRPVAVKLRMQHAINASVMQLSKNEAETIATLPEVLLVEPQRDLPLDTEVGPIHIGAGPLWSGIDGVTSPVQGEGMIIGVIDSGINFGSPSFAAVGPVDGYVHANPFGSGNYLGTCAPGGVDEGRCTDKLIGGYDFVCGPPANACTNAALREEPGFGDTNGHGSHTASTAAGNVRDAVYSGNTLRISGVAPRANIIAYDACYTEISTGRGLCPNSSTTASIDQAVADGVVDVINYSIAGGTSPWTEAASLAFLNATDAGIYVAASAGNSGPGANTMGHHEPWTASTAAANHGRAGFGIALYVTGPTPVPANLAPVIVNSGTGGVAFSATIPGSTPLKISAGIDTASDGCAAFPANTFAGAIALVRRGTCSFTIKVNNAAVAGAVAVVIANNAAGIIVPNVPGTTVPVFSVTQAEGDALRNFGQANPSTATAQIVYPPMPLPNVADALGVFSSRGPAGTYDLVKPDITAPGVDILAVVSGTTLTGSENAVDLMSGTSMASPHNAGAALLVRQLRPSWTPSEVKSALVMTATRTVYKEDGATPATPFDMGGGRIRVNLAANAGLLLDETVAHYAAANPVTGGSISSLNLPNLARRSCVFGCQFVRTFTNPWPTDSSWTASVQGLPGTVSPASFTVPAYGTIKLTIDIVTTALDPNGVYGFATVVLGRDGGTADDELSLPVAVSVPPPVLAYGPIAHSKTLREGTTGSVSSTLSNVGGFPLHFSMDQTDAGRMAVARSDSTGIASGFRSTVYTDPATAGNQAQFASDDFVLELPTQIRTIAVQGFVVSNVALTSAATNLTWSIYPDAGGLPAGNPQTNPAAAIWTYTSTPLGAGVLTEGSSGIRLDLVAAGQSVSLPPGRYWIVVNTRGTFVNRYAWYGSNTASGNSGFASITIATNGTGTWTANPSFQGLTFQIVGDIPCGAPWITGSSPSSGSLTSGSSQVVTTSLSASGLVMGDYLGALCVHSNDPVWPSLASPVRLTVVAPPDKLVFTVPPSTDAVAGLPWPQQPSIAVQDDTFTTVTEYVAPVLLAIASGPGTLTCDANPVIPVNGVATFSGCRVHGVGTVTLTASSGSVVGSTTNPSVTMVPGPAAQLAFTTPPSLSATAGAVWGQQPVVTVQDALGYTVTDHATPVTLALASGAGPLTCDATSVVPVNGIAAFTGCHATVAGLLTLNASSGAMANSTTNPRVIISHDVPVELAFTTPPSATAIARTPWPVQPALTLRDAFGNTATSYTTGVTLALASGSGVLTCDSNPVVPVDGIASFTGCQVDTVGTVTLNASSGAVAGSTTTPQIILTFAAASELVFTTPPAATATAGEAWTPQPVVTVHDAFGNTVTDYASPVMFSLASGAGPLTCDVNPVVPVNGVASFTGCQVTTAGTITLDASAGSIVNATTNPQVVISPAAASELVFTTPPSPTAVANLALPQQPVVTVRDAFGNIVTSHATPVTLALASGSGILTCDTNPVVPVDGIALFTGCQVDTVGTVTLNASSGAVASATTTPQIVLTFAAASQLVFTTAPGTIAEAGSAWLPQPVVTVRDAFGNTVTDYASPVTLSLASGTGPLMCDVNPVMPVSGVASFTGCHVTTAGTVTLDASAGSIANATTNPQVVISPAAASELVFTTTPTPTAAVHAAWPQQPAVTVRDAFANIVTSYATPVALELAAGSGFLTCDTNPVLPVNGVALFTGCQVDTVGTVALNALSGTIANATTTPQVILTAATASQLVFTTPPSPTATAGAAWAQQPAVTVRDAFGNTVTDYASPVTLSVASGAGPLACAVNPVMPVSGVASFTGCQITTAGTITIDAAAGSIATATTNPQVIIAPATASELVFMTPPSANAAAGSAWALQPVVTVRDAFGNTVIDYASPVTLSLVSGTGPLTCDTNPMLPVNGVASFTGCQVTTAGTITLDASAGSIANASTNPQVVITPAAAAELVFTTTPTPTAAVHAAWPQQPAVTVRDAFGNTVTSHATPVSLALVTGSGILTCDTNPVVPVNGVALFAGCQVDTVGTVTLNASSGSLANATTAPQVIVTPAAASQLVFTTSPSANVAAGSAWAQQPVVTVQDPFGNAVTDHASPVTLSLASGTGPLTCDVNPVMPVSGVASFTGCQVTTAGTITLDASAGSIANASTNPQVVINPAAASELVFTTIPNPTAVVNAVWSQQPAVTVRDAFGNIVTSHATPVTLALATGSGILTCDTNPVVPVNGVALFAGCQVDTVGTVTLNASSGSLANATTAPQVILTPAAASQLVFTTSPSANADAGSAWAEQPVVTIRDAFGNTVTDYASPVTLSLASGTGPLTCDVNPVMPVSGVAAFTGCQVTTAGTITLDASAGSIANATTTPQVVIAPAAASELVFTTTPTPTAVVNAAWPEQPAVTVRDAFGNTVTSYTTPVTLALASGSGTLTCDTNPVVPVNGVALFAGCQVDAVGTVTLNASSGSLANATTAPQVVLTFASASQLVFTTPPSPTATAGVAWAQQPVVTVQDPFGNTVPDYNSPVTLSLASGTGPLTCDVNPVMPVNGVAAFTGCQVTTAGTVTLDASAGSIANATTPPQVAVAPATASELVFTMAPSQSAGVNEVWPQQPVVTVYDPFGNIVTAYTTPVTLTLLSGAGVLTCDVNPVTPVDGVAAFTGCRIDSPGVFTIGATSGGAIVSVTSPAMHIAAPVPGLGPLGMATLGLLLGLAALFALRRPS